MLNIERAESQQCDAVKAVVRLSPATLQQQAVFDWPAAKDVERSRVSAERYERPARGLEPAGFSGVVAPAAIGIPASEQ